MNDLSVGNEQVEEHFSEGDTFNVGDGQLEEHSEGDACNVDDGQIEEHSRGDIICNIEDLHVEEHSGGEICNIIEDGQVEGHSGGDTCNEEVLEKLTKHGLKRKHRFFKNSIAKHVKYMKYTMKSI